MLEEENGIWEVDGDGKQTEMGNRWSWEEIEDMGKEMEMRKKQRWGTI